MKKEMEQVYTTRQLEDHAHVKWEKVFAKSRFTFNLNTGTVYLIFQFIVPQHFKLNKSILLYIHDFQRQFKVEKASANNMHT